MFLIQRHIWFLFSSEQCDWDPKPHVLTGSLQGQCACRDWNNLAPRVRCIQNYSAEQARTTPRSFETEIFCKSLKSSNTRQSQTESRPRCDHEGHRGELDGIRIYKVIQTACQFPWLPPMEPSPYHIYARSLTMTLSSHIRYAFRAPCKPVMRYQ